MDRLWNENVHYGHKVRDGVYISPNLYCLMMTEEALPEESMLDLEAAEPQDVVMPAFNPIGDLWNVINALREEVRIIKVEIDTSQGTIKGVK